MEHTQLLQQIKQKARSSSTQQQRNMKHYPWKQYFVLRGKIPLKHRQYPRTNECDFPDVKEEDHSALILKPAWDDLVNKT